MSKKAEILKLYNEGLSISSIAEELNITSLEAEKTIANEYERLDKLNAKRQAEAIKIFEVFNRVQSIQLTADEIGCGLTKVYTALKSCPDFDLPRQTIKTALSREIALEFANGESVADIAKAHNISLPTVYKYLHQENIDTKDNAYSNTTRAIINDLIRSDCQRGYMSRIAAKNGVSRQLVSRIAAKYLK